MSFIEVNGTALRYELDGSGIHTMVLIHEMGGSLESWDLVAPRLADGRRVLRYDTRGAGLSEKLRGDLSLDIMVADLMALLDALKIVGKVALVGTAVGGAIALASAARFPERIAAVVASSPATGIAADRRAAVLARIERMERAGLRAVSDALDNGYPAELRGDGRRFAAFRARWLGNDPASFAAVYRMLVHLDLTDDLARIERPVLLIGGAFDATRPAGMVETLAGRIRHARYLLLHTGHYAAVQTPEILASAVLEFIAHSVPEWSQSLPTQT
ncbi:MAG TPA: alpha/beta hydrolase [Hyphomicrobiaceae bacterium]|nr:alpha/beta hydrolase [Hyphomicrobiaceae bacterium]